MCKVPEAAIPSIKKPKAIRNEKLKINKKVWTYRIYKMHHCSVALACVAIALMGRKYWPSLTMVIFMWLYSDLYSAILHAALDDKKSLNYPGIAPVARGFQDHHDYPMESTLGKGLYELCCDTVRIQWITGSLSLLFSRSSYTTLLLIILKWLTCAYGTQVGHYYAHCGNHAPVFIRLLQKTHLLLPPKAHWTHHIAPYECNFGIVNGLANYMMNPILLTSGPFYKFEVVLGAWIFLTCFDVAIIERIFA